MTQTHLKGCTYTESIIAHRGGTHLDASTTKHIIHKLTGPKVGLMFIRQVSCPDLLQKNTDESY